MNKSHKNSARASALQIVMAIALMAASAVLLASTFRAAQSDPVSARPDPIAPSVTCGGPIRVEATNSGNDANYATMALAFAAINAGTHTGVINIGVCTSVTDATSAVLNASGTGSASYTSVLITPAGGAARTLDGAIAAGSPLIDLNGADNVTIDGLNSGGNSLTIANTTASATASTSTIRLFNGASNNVITNCSLQGSSTAAVTTAGGTVLISTSTGGANDSNTISNNNIGPAGANLPSKAILSLGSASPNHNTNNIITNNNVFDFFTAAANCTGISLQSNTATNTVSNNRIFQTAPRVFTGTFTYSGITQTTSGFNNTITGNRVGFANSGGTGVTDISGSTNVVVGLNLTSSSTATASSIQNNVISGIVQSSASTGTSTSAPFRGIYLAAGRYDVGTTTGNRIGSLDGSSTIALTYSSTGAVYGIYDFTSSSNPINNNQIGAITINGTGTGTGGFRGIYLNTSSAATATVNNNQIGAAGAGAITDNLVGSYTNTGIYNALAVLNATGNTIRNMVGSSNGTSIICASGMLLVGTGTTGGPNMISQNVIHSLSNNSGTANNSIYALYCSFPATTANVVQKNIVHSLSITSTNTASQLVGILPVAGSGTYKNNMVRLGVDAAGASITTGYAIYGMFEVAGTNNLYYNSVYLGGTNVNDAQSTFGFVSNVTSGTRNYIDNIFDNARSNGAGTGKHYAIALSGVTGATCNRNDLYAPGTGGFVGSSPGLVDQLTLANWQGATGFDANSISADPQFIDPNGTARPGFGTDVVDALVNLHIQGGSPCVNAGAPAGGVGDDIDGDFRPPTTPDIGADQVTSFTGGSVTITKTADAASVSSGSQVGYLVKLTNSLPGTATGLSVTDALPAATGVNWSIDGGATDPGWSVSGSPPTQSLVYTPTTLAGNSTTQAHVVSNTTSGTCGATLNNTASFTTGNSSGSGNASASIIIVGPASKILAELFDSVTPPALPGGWTASNAVAGDGVLWVTSASGTPTPVADTAPNAAYVTDPTSVSDKRLDSPAVAIGSTSATITFRQNYQLESGFDGGILEVSINGGAFTDIAAVGSFVTGGYNGVVSTAFSNPLSTAGGTPRPAWTNTTSGAFITTTARLPASAAGGTVIFRWRMGSDTSASGAGWRIDGVSVNDFPCPGAPTPTPAPTASPTPTATASPSPTATISPPPTVCVLPIEDMADITNLVIPKGYYMQNNSQPGPGSTGWFQGSTAVFNAQAGAGNSYIGTNYNNGTGTSTLSNWLLTPPLTLQTGGQLSFWTRTVSSPAFPDRLQVRMSTNTTSTNVGATSTSVGDFTTLLIDINPTYTTSGYPNAWTQVVATLPAMATTKGRLAFRYFVENGGPSGANSDYIGIDSVEYNCGGGIGPTPTPAGPTPTPTPSPTPTPTVCPGFAKVFTELFDGVTAPALPVGWSTSFVNGTAVTCPPSNPTPTPPTTLCTDGSNWVTTTNTPDSGPNAAFHNDPSCISDNNLDSVSIPINSSSASLTFRNHYIMESGFDGGVLEISIGGGAFTDIITAGGSWVTGGYNAAISTAWGSTIGGRQAWTGTNTGSPAYITTTANLPAAAAGQNIVLRFRMGSDCSVSSTGWWVDGVSISDCPPAASSISGTALLCAAAAPTPTPNVQLAGVTMTLTGTSAGSTTTDGAGFYQFLSLANGGNYTITPTKARRTPGSAGINTVDVVAEQNQALSRVLLTGCRLAAGECAGGAGINTVDVLAIQAFALGRTIPAQIGNVGIYTFSPAARAYTPLSSSQTNQNFDTLILGDVANPVANPRPGGPAPEMATGSVASVRLPDVNVSRTAPVTTTVIDAASNLVAFQTDITFDERAITFTPEAVQATGLTAMNWNVAANVLEGSGPIRTLRVIGYSTDMTPLSGSGVLFNLNVASVNAGNTQLNWSAEPENAFYFVDAALNMVKPVSNANGAAGQR